MLRKFSKITGFAAIILFLTQGCSTLSNGHGWGQDVTATPGWKKAGNSALDAVTSPGVWLPAVTAIMLQYKNLDARISKQASEHNYLFGSQTSAANATSWLDGIAIVSYGATFLATPSGNDSQDWLNNKSKGLAVEGAAIGMTGLFTSELKGSTHRQRPDKSNYNSFPSGEASNAAVLTMLSILNLKSINIPNSNRWVADVGLYTVSIGTAWSRVEAQKHYPSDALAGMALGNFMAAFFYNSFMGLDKGIQPQISIGPGEYYLGVHIPF
jgi:hypothetical protein